MSCKETKAYEDLDCRLEDLSMQPMKMDYFYEDNNSGWTATQPSMDTCLFPSFRPLFVVIDPGTDNWYNANVLCDFYNNGCHNIFKQIGDWPKYVFFSPRCTQGLMDMVNVFKKQPCRKNKKSHFYHKELKAKVYQFEQSSFRYAILKGNIRKIEINNKIGDTIEYLIFPFASHRNHETGLYGLAQVNENRNNSKQKWRCDAVFTKCGLVKFFQQWSETNINKNNKFEDVMIPQPIEYQHADAFDTSLDISVSDEILVKFKGELFNYCYNNKNGGSNRYCHRAGNRNSSFNKFDYFLDIMYAMGVNEIDFFNLLEKSINDGIKFAKMNPQTVLSQVYIDSKFARLYYEHTLYCDLRNPRDGLFYKFGLPMILKNRENKYEIKGILTTKMAMDNVGLNYPQSRFTDMYDTKWWNSSMEDSRKSFYDFYKENATKSVANNSRDRPAAPVMKEDQEMMSTAATSGKSSVAVIVSAKQGRKNRGKSHSSKKGRKRSVSSAIEEISTPCGINTSKLNQSIEQLLSNPGVSESCLLYRFTVFAETLFEFCQKIRISCLFVSSGATNNDNNNKNNHLIIESKNAANGNEFTDDYRWKSFWDVLFALSKAQKANIVEKFGQNSLLFRYLSKAALTKQKETHPQLVHTAWLEKMHQDYLVAAKSAYMQAVAAAAAAAGGASTGDVSKNKVDKHGNIISSDIVVKPAKKAAVRPTKPPMLSTQTSEASIMPAMNPKVVC